MFHVNMKQLFTLKDIFQLAQIMWTKWEFHFRPDLNELPSTKLSPIGSFLLFINN